MSTKRALWMAKDDDGTVCLFSEEPVLLDGVNHWCSDGWYESVNDLFYDTNDAKYRTIISQTISKPWRESKCRVYVTIQEI